MSTRLFVGNLAVETTSEEIKELFGAYGVVESCHLIEDRETGQRRGFGFINMESGEAADAAKERLNGHDLHGKALAVNIAKPKATPGRL